MIIVTGCDNTGKTSLVRHINTKFGIPIAPRFKPLPPKNPEDYDKWAMWVQACLEDYRNIYVYDRFFIDELVYGPIIRGCYGSSIKKMSLLSSMLLLRQPLYIYTSIPIGMILSSFDGREQYLKRNEVEKIVNKFSEVHRSWPIKYLNNRLTYNYNQDRHYKQIDKKIEKYLEGALVNGKCIRL